MLIGENQYAVKKCPFCGGEKFIEGYQSGYATVHSTKKLFSGAFLYHQICIQCGSVVRSYVKKPEKLLRWRDR